ncbi:OmpA family protein [Enterobacter asburiae]|uniref:OmpA family protein n=1 Tax=Enterobacter asburiae TaxID=61645 RepID=UPI002075D112|nr:OmpA family protein [Enterobacter asburiae]MCM7773306.1 OmpA family protein [Enterobacter asburiae]
MVKSEHFFCRLIGIDTLISFDGIIPSAADFQLRLISLIEQFNKALQEENQAAEESEALCQLLCGYFDKRLMITQKDNALSWERYSLMHYFYGYTQSQANDDITSLLAALLRSDSKLIFRYARKLLTLLEQVEGQTDALTSLRATCAPRTWLMRAEADPEPEKGDEDTPATSPRLMVLITGPFARKWFHHANLSTSDNGHIVWMVAEHSTTLASRLTHAEETHPPMATVALFPVLVDGMENSALLTEQLMSWQYAFTSIRLNRQLPCIPAFYTRLSQQRHSHDPDRAIWTRSLTPHGQLTLESCFHDLVDKLNARDDGQNLYAIQRYALGSTFIAWLAESRLMNVMQTLFKNTPLDLAGVILADYGQGFTRHGAWSQWLGERYGILPALSATIAMPPLPPLPLPPLPEPEAAWPTPVPLVKPAPRRRSPLPAIITLLLLLACLAGGVYYYARHNIGEIREQIRQFSPLRENVAADDNASIFPLADTVPLFANGSSNLMPDSEKTLLTIVPAIRRSPEKIFLIIGHSDSTGSAATNMALSAERAQVIKDWLVAYTGLPAEQFITEGAGDTRPVANNDTKEGRAQNRRVEIIPLSR